MERTLSKILKDSRIENDEDLTSSIFRSISKIEKRNFKIKIYSYALICIISFISVFPSISYTFKELSQSGFYDYFSIIFSDISLAFSAGEDLIISLVSTLPVLSILVSAIFVFVTLIFSKKVFWELKRPLLVI